MSIGTEYPRMSVDQIKPFTAGGDVQFGDGPFPGGFNTHGISKVQVQDRTLTGNLTVLASDPNFQRMDPDGLNRTITLPPESAGRWYWLHNSANGAEDLDIVDDAAGAIVTLNQDEAAFIVSTDTAWVVLGVHTVTLT